MILLLLTATLSQLTIYYEALCPDTAAFFNTQLNNLNIRDDHTRDIDIEYVPAGKMFKTGNELNCQHGPKECKINKAMNCFLVHFQDKYVRMRVMNCYFRKGLSPNTTWETFIACVIEEYLDPYSTYQCMNTKEGQDLLEKAWNKTKTVDPKFIPTMVWEGKFSKQNQNEMLKNLGPFICNQLGSNCLDQ